MALDSQIGLPARPICHRFSKPCFTSFVDSGSPQRPSETFQQKTIRNLSEHLFYCFGLRAGLGRAADGSGAEKGWGAMWTGERGGGNNN